MRTGRGALLRAVPGMLAVALTIGCAKITTHHVVHTLLRAGGAPRTLGNSGGEIAERRLGAQWVQRLDALEVTVTEHYTCIAPVYVPVVRIETIERRADGAIYWEYGLGIALAAFATVALTRPDLFGQPSYDPNSGAIHRDPGAGYRVGGIFLGIAVPLLFGGIWDTARARDETRYADAYAVRPGPQVPCAEPATPLKAAVVELVVGEWRKRAETDERGHVQLLLPPQDAVPAEEGRLHRGVVRTGSARAVAIDFITPYTDTTFGEHTGSASP